MEKDLSRKLSVFKRSKSETKFIIRAAKSQILFCLHLAAATEMHFSFDVNSIFDTHTCHECQAWHFKNNKIRPPNKMFFITWYEEVSYNFIETFLINHMSNTQINFRPVIFSSDVQYIVVYNRTASQNIDSSINDIFMKTKTCQIKVCEKFVRMDRLWKKNINVIIDSHHPLYRNY